MITSMPTFSESILDAFFLRCQEFQGKVSHSPHMGFNHRESVLIHIYIYIMVISVDTSQRMGMSLMIRHDDFHGVLLTIIILGISQLNNGDNI